MPRTKELRYDPHSLRVQVGDEVTVTIQHGNSEPETFEAVYAGNEQVGMYTTPYLRFLVDNVVRLVHAHSVREMVFDVQLPEVAAKALPSGSSTQEW